MLEKNTCGLSPQLSYTVMKVVIFFCSVLMALASAQAVSADILFQDGFESGTLRQGWVPTITNQGRVEISSNNGPATGTAHLVLDDHFSDTTFSSAQITLLLDLTNKKNVILSFKSKSLGNEPHSFPNGNFTGARNYDGVAISADGGTTWRGVESLANASPSWRDHTILLDTALASLGGSYRSDFRIRFSQYDNAPAPLDGIAIDDVSVTADENQVAILEMPSAITEGAAPQTGYVFLALPLVNELTLTLTISAAGLTGIPGLIDIPAGETFASFEFSATDDILVNLPRGITITVTAPGVLGVGRSVNILANEIAPAVTLVLPAAVTEGNLSASSATLSVASPLAVPVVFTLTSSPLSQIILPNSVTLPAGQLQMP